jgi:Protein of unknown function (DUF2892)
MKRNMGLVDRLLRGLVLGPALIVLSVAVFDVGSVLGVVSLVVAGVMFVTAAVGVCPGYTPFGISTRDGISTRGHVRFDGRARVAAQH